MAEQPRSPPVILPPDDQFPPSGATDWRDRFQDWMSVSKWRRWLVAGAMFIVGWHVLMAAILGVAYLRNSTDSNAAGVATNLVLVFFMATVLLAVIRAAAYRWAWHIDRKIATGQLRHGDKIPEFGSERTPPVPHVNWPVTLRLRHALFYVIGVATLLYGFMPYEHQVAMTQFVTDYSFGRRSRGQLQMLLFAHLPMILLLVLAMFLNRRQLRRRDSGLLDSVERLLLKADMTWMLAFAFAFTGVSLFSRIFGDVIVHALS